MSVQSRPRDSLFRPQAPHHPFSPPRPATAPTELDGLQTTAQRLNRRFVLTNTITVATMLAAILTVPELVAARVYGRLTIGMILVAASAGVLLWTTARFDRGCVRELETPASWPRQSAPPGQTAPRPRSRHARRGPRP